MLYYFTFQLQFISQNSDLFMDTFLSNCYPVLYFSEFILKVIFIQWYLGFRYDDAVLITF